MSKAEPGVANWLCRMVWICVEVRAASGLPTANMKSVKSENTFGLHVPGGGRTSNATTIWKLVPVLCVDVTEITAICVEVTPLPSVLDMSTAKPCRNTGLLVDQSAAFASGTMKIIWVEVISPVPGTP